MMLRQFLLASLLVVAFADHHEDGHDDDYHYVDDLLGCCSQEDRRDVQEMWKSIWSFVTDSKVEICRQMFGGSVVLHYFLLITLHVHQCFRFIICIILYYLLICRHTN